MYIKNKLEIKPQLCNISFLRYKVCLFQFDDIF